MTQVIDNETREIQQVTVRPDRGRDMAPVVPPDRIALVKQTVAKGVTDEELALFIAVCNRTGLDPFSKQIYAIKRWDGRAQREIMGIQVAIDGLRLQAQRSREFAGEVGPYWCGPDMQWTEVWLSETPPAAAKVGVLRAGDTVPTWGVATYREYCQRTKEGKPQGLWASMPGNQLAKCAEAQALRKRFAAETMHLSLAEEMTSEEAEDFRLGEVARTALEQAKERTGKTAVDMANGPDEEERPHGAGVFTTPQPRHEPRSEPEEPPEYVEPDQPEGSDMASPEQRSALQRFAVKASPSQLAEMDDPNLTAARAGKLLTALQQRPKEATPA